MALTGWCWCLWCSSWRHLDKRTNRIKKKTPPDQKKILIKSFSPVVRRYLGLLVKSVGPQVLRSPGPLVRWTGSERTVQKCRRSFLAKDILCIQWYSGPIFRKFIFLITFFFPKQCGHRRVRLIRCYLHYIHASRNPPTAFRLRRLAKSGGPRRVLVATALSLWCRAHFLT